MLDTLKVKIPLSDRQYDKFTKQIQQAGGKQWVQLDTRTGEIDFFRVRGLAEADQNSYHRQIRFDLPNEFIPGMTYLVCEFSLPKFHYGHNVSLLYDWIGALRRFKRLLERQFGLTSKRWGHLLPEPESWELLRADFCYSYQFPSQPSCHKFLESLKRFSYPRKRPTLNDTSIMFVGATYSLKIYEKQPEFKAHDAKELVKARAAQPWIDYLVGKAAGVLRVEATLRRKYLKREGMTTVADLLAPSIKFLKPDDWPTGRAGEAILYWLLDNHLEQKKVDSFRFTESCELTEPDSGSVYLWLDDSEQPEYIDESDPDCYSSAFEHKLTGLKAQVLVEDRIESSLQFFISKFLGGCPGMQTIDQIRIALAEHYKPAKVGRLSAFWLYVQRFGAKDAREQFGHNSYYVAKRDLNKAGVSLLSYAENVVPLDKDFALAFKMRCPSEYVSNKFDDYTDGDNLLNLPVASSE